MPVCNLCGSQTERIFRTMIEGAEMRVCPLCAKLGQVIEEVIFETAEPEEYVSQNVRPSRSSAAPSRTIDVLASDYGRRVKNAREKKGWKQKELATKLAIKESLLHNIESGHFEPNMELAAKLERFLHITLIDQVDDKPVNLQQIESGPMTLGDMIKFKKKK
jgi:putative transcription factor